MVPPADAVSVALCAVVTAETVAVNPALVAPEGTVTDPGTLTELLLLNRLTVEPPPPAAAERVTEHASTPEPMNELCVHDSELTPAILPDPESEPLPCKLIFREGLVEELVVTISCPVASPCVVGVNCKGTLYVPPFAATVMGNPLGFAIAKLFPVIFKAVTCTTVEP